MHRSFFVRVVILALVPLMAGCVIHLGSDESFRETRTLGDSHEPGTGIAVLTRNGTVDIRRGGVDRVRIVAHLSARTHERVSGARIETGRRRDGFLQVQVRWPHDRLHAGEGCSFEIDVPDATGVEVHTSNGDVRLEGLGGSADLVTSNGDVAVRNHEGAVRVRSDDGSVRLEGIVGEIRAWTSDGRIDINGAAGPVDATTSDGRLEVNLRDDAPGPVRLTSSDGDIRLGIGPGFRGELRLESSNGRVRHELPEEVDRVTEIRRTSRSTAILVFGDPLPVSTVVTNDGDITLKLR